jgi:hypothetical protein
MAYTSISRVNIDFNAITTPTASPVEPYYFYPQDIIFLLNQRKEVGNGNTVGPDGFQIFPGSAKITGIPGEICKTGPVLVAFYEDQSGKHYFNSPDDKIAIACPPWTKKGGVDFINLEKCP